MKLSVVILNYNVRNFLELCLQSVEQALVNIQAEIIVVDNHSTDSSVDMITSKFPEVKLIVNTENYGFSKGNNIGVAQAKGQYVCILNPDTVIAEDTFEHLLKFTDSQKNLGILGCRLVDGTGQFLPESKRHVPTPTVALKKMLGLSESYYANQVGQKEIGRVSILVGAFMLLKRSIYNEVGGFDEAYFMYGDDIDLSYKVHNLGYENMYNGTSTVIHFKGESTLKDKVYAKRFYGAMQIFYKKHFRSNVVFDLLVWFGTRFASWFQKPIRIINIEPERRILISNNSNTQLAANFDTEILRYQDKTEYILDNNFLSFKSIIGIISNRPKNCNATFKILPKKSTFMLGSNSSKNKGTVIPIHEK